MKTQVVQAGSPGAIAHAVDVLRNGGLVVFPTDTVYGLAVLAFNEDFVESIYRIKGPESQNVIGILIASHDQLPQVTPAPGKTLLALAKAFWPGPLTLMVERGPALPENITSQPMVGVRIPDHPVALGILRQAGPLAVTSANAPNHDFPATAAEVLAQLNGRIHLLLDGGKVPGGVPSTVVDCSGPEPVILRQGPISRRKLFSALAASA